MRLKVVLTVLCCLLASRVIAAEDVFTVGPVFGEYGPVAEVETTTELSGDEHFRISFDTNTAADLGELSRTLVSAARFINMHVRAGVPVENIDLAVVIHGKAVYDVTNAERYKSAKADGNADVVNMNAVLVQALLETGVQVIVCGQSAAYYDVHKDDLLPGVQMELSAMTAHALLQQDGYTLNPF